jgi:hypothetical protein
MAGNARLNEIRASLAGKTLDPGTPAPPLTAGTADEGGTTAEKTS